MDLAISYYLCKRCRLHFSIHILVFMLIVFECSGRLYYIQIYAPMSSQKYWNRSFYCSQILNQLSCCLDWWFKSNVDFSVFEKSAHCLADICSNLEASFYTHTHTKTEVQSFVLSMGKIMVSMVIMEPKFISRLKRFSNWPLCMPSYYTFNSFAFFNLITLKVFILSIYFVHVFYKSIFIMSCL